MRRHELTDDQFKKIEIMLPGRKGHAGVTAKDNRIFINSVLWIFKTGAPWRDLPERYSHWKYEEHQDIMEAARRERRLKNWCRKWKLNSIEQFNPTWRDLYTEIST